MIKNFKELDKKIEKIVKIFEKQGFNCRFFSNTNIKIVDNSMANTTSTGEVGSITMTKDGKITIKLTGSEKKQKIKSIMHKTERVFGPNKLLLEIGAETRILIKNYKDAIKKIAKEL